MDKEERDCENVINMHCLSRQSLLLNPQSRKKVVYKKRDVFFDMQDYLTWVGIWCDLLNEEGWESRVCLVCISGTFLVIWMWISPLFTPCRGIHLSDIWFGGNLWYSTTPSPILDSGSKALWSLTCSIKGLPSSRNSNVWFQRGLSVLCITYQIVPQTTSK